MESNFKIINGHYNFGGPENLSLVVILFFTALLLLVKIMSRDRKPAVNKNALQPVSFFTLFSHCVRRFLGLYNKSIFEVMMDIGSMLTIPQYAYSCPVVGLSNDHDVIKEVLNSPDVWVDRPKNEMFAFRSNGNQQSGILTSSGPVWKGMRKYAIKTLTLLGLGKKSNLEYTTNEELKDLLHDTAIRIQKTNNNVPLRGIFSRAVINVIWRIVGGTRFSLEDPEFTKLIEATDVLTETSPINLFFADLFGIDIVLKVPSLFGLGRQLHAQEIMKKNFTNILQKRQEALSLKDTEELIEEENFTDHFLRKMISSNNTEENKLDPIYNLDNLFVTLYDLFEAGADTTSSALEFAIMCLATHPEVHSKMISEIETVIGDREPSYYTDRINMPYSQAVISEVHRMGSIVPLNFRSATRDCYLNGVFIKKGTLAAINQYSIHYDEKFWKDPSNFRPERFLTDEGQLDKSKLNRLVNFGGGRRVCIGEAVANISIFTYLVGLLQKYQVKMANPNEKFGMEKNSSFTSRPNPFHVHFVPL